MKDIKFKFVKGKDIAGPFELGNKSIPWYIEDGYIPLQFTGLLDKNGKEIYVGDVLKWPTDGEREVVYNEDCPGYYVVVNQIHERLFKNRMKYFEKIRNKYERNNSNGQQ